MPALDRSKVMKGVGELFARSRVENNVHGGLGEKEMFHRMAEWGFDHCRYALAFDADWDLPLVNFRGGPDQRRTKPCGSGSMSWSPTATRPACR